MHQHQKISQLLLRNEDWIIAEILVDTKNYSQIDYLSLINFSWQLTINSFSESIIKVHKQYKLNDNKIIFNSLESSFYSDYVQLEALKCLERKISPHTYLSFLKTIKEVYCKLVFNSNFISTEKYYFSQFIGKWFDCIDVVFVKAMSELVNNVSNKKVLSTQNLEVQTLWYNLLPIPVLFVNQFNSVIRFNKAAIGFFPNLLENGSAEFDDSISIKGIDSFNAKIDEFRISLLDEIKFEVSLSTSSGNFFTLIRLKKLIGVADIMISFIDLSEWKSKVYKLEERVKNAEESNSLKTIFLANMSHEIRTPMNSILGFSELLTTTKPLPKVQKQYLSMIRKSSNDLLNIIEDVTDIAKIESKQLKISNKATRPSEILMDLNRLYIELLERQGNKDIRLIVRIPENEENLCFRTDPKRLKQVLSNLIGNANKFTEKGTIEIGYKMAENKLIYFYVKDSGIGIPYDMQASVFDLFVQVDEQRTMNNNGTGLGLAISKNIINLLGGKIWLSSVPGKGSNFYFYLPNISVPVSNKKQNIPKSDLRKKNIVKSKAILTG